MFWNLNALFCVDSCSVKRNQVLHCLQCSYIFYISWGKKPSKRILFTVSKIGLLTGNYYILERFPGSLFYLIALWTEYYCFAPTWKLGHSNFFTHIIYLVLSVFLTLCEAPLLWSAEKVTPVARYLPKKGVEIYFIWWVRQTPSERKRFKTLQEAEGKMKDLAWSLHFTRKHTWFCKTPCAPLMGRGQLCSLCWCGHN